MPNPRATMIDEGAALARKEKVDFIIGLGGGSAMDSAKAIALAKYRHPTYLVLHG